MSFERRGSIPLDYDPVTYPGSVLRFRGPQSDLVQPYIVCLGGSETFGRFIHAPFPAQLDAMLPMPVVNLGVMNAGLDVLTRDPAICAAAERAEAIVLQITGAQNMTNRFYSVHPRRNDRFIKASAMLRTIYRDVDFTEFHFTRHLLTRLRSLSAERFEIVAAELRTAWVARMIAYIKAADRPVHLLWLSRRAPGAHGAGPGLGEDPLFVTEEMLEEVSAHAASLTVAVSPRRTGAGRATRGMFYAAREEKAARVLPGPDGHDRAARCLRSRLAEMKPRPAATSAGRAQSSCQCRGQSLSVSSGTASNRSATRP